MITQLLTSTLMALWLGILTSISPCPMTTNLAAISFIGKRTEKRHVLLTGVCYTAGRMAAYAVLGILILGFMLSMPVLSFWLQKTINRVLGPFMIVVGLILLNIFKISMKNGKLTKWAQNHSSSASLSTATLLGVVFALSFCPISAALFFGSLIPIAVENNSYFVIPTIYGVGTALPVLASSFCLAYGMGSIGRFFNKMQRFDLWARRITGALFILIGTYLTWTLTL